MRGRSKQRRQGGTQRKGVEGRNQNGDRNRDRELLVQPPGDPGMNAVGMKTADSTRAMPTTGPEISSIALKVASFGDMPFVDVVLDRLDDDDGIVHHEPDRQTPGRTATAC